MTFEGMGEMFEGDSSDTCADRGPSGGSRMRRPGSKDPHWRERKLLTILELAELEQDFYINPYNTKTLLSPKKWPLYSAGNTFTRPKTGVGVK